MRRVLLVVLGMLGLLGLLAGMAEGADHVDSARAALVVTQAPIAHGVPDAKEEESLYAVLLKHPTRLGFKPGHKHFVTMYEMVRKLHVDEPSESQLFAGVAEEVGILVRSAKQSVAGLDGLPRDTTLPDRIVAACRGKIDPTLVWYAMLRGLTRGTDDPYTAYLMPAEYHNMAKMLSSANFVGAGLIVDQDPRTRKVSVVYAIEGSPADTAGFIPGDEIVRINEGLSRTMSLENIYAALRGERGTSVFLTYQRPGEEKLRVTSLTRAPFEMPSVRSSVLTPSIGYIRLYSFGLTTASRMKDALETFKKQGVKHLILDVRNNPGGTLSAAAEACGLFLQPDQVVSSMLDREGHHVETRGGGLSRYRMHIVLLTNESSASASEIMAACLKDYGLATLVGVTTFGKGCSQRVFPMNDGSAFKITATYFTGPKGTRINKTGIAPDVRVEMEKRWVGKTEHDVQLKKAIEYLEREAD